MSIGVFAYSSDSSFRELPSVRIGAGMMSYFGNVGTRTSVAPNSFSDTRSGFQFGVEDRLTTFLAVSIDGLYGHLSGNDHSAYDNLNFETKVIHGGINLILPFDNGIIMKRHSDLIPFLSIGIGYMTFQPYGDLTDSKGNPYYYWSDGSIRNLPESSPIANTAIQVQRRYNYNTPLAGPQSSLTFPVGFGFRFNFTDQLGANIGVIYHYTLTNHIDNVNAGAKDKFLYTSVSIHYQFNRRKDSDKGYGEEPIFDQGDSDTDGINDLLDVCPGTPKGVKVDAKGCPLDADGDGIPDYLDKEPNSKKGAVVDQSGVTINYKEVATKNKQDLKTFARNDSISDALNKYFNNRPRKDVLDSLEKNRVTIHKTTGKQLPSEYMSVDKNHDGIISVAELTGAIDDFFSGGSDLTVDKLNKLIDFFFEQL
jgi:predicted DNA-binding WGR domain protein